MPPAEPIVKGPPSTAKILLDTPAESPVLGFGEIGHGLATIISESEPRFTLGIFGGWGTGKTTLMTAIKNALPGETLMVDFNAWRFEREPQLLIPLLDSIRAELIRWSAGRGAETSQKARSIAARIGRVVRALASGLSGEAGIPGAAKVSYDLGKALNNLSAQVPADEAQSLYLAAFQELAAAFQEFSSGNVVRVVIFVDDLDRCLPGNALEVLESIKLFFDLPGFIFVVGLDENILVRVLRTRFFSQEEGATGASAEQADTSAMAVSQRLSREYMKKIFQISYSLPAMLPQQLDDLLESIYARAELGAAQLSDLQHRVRPYLGYIAVGRRVNPRDVKRFINAYTLQALVRPDLDRDTVLALQTLAFRDEWAGIYDAVLTDSDMFTEMLRRYRHGEDDETAFGDLSASLRVLPASLISYLRSPLAEPLLRHPSLDPYISSLQSTRGASSWILDAYQQIGMLRRHMQQAFIEPTPQEFDAINSAATTIVRRISDILSSASRPEGSARIEAILDDIRRTADETAALANRRQLTDTEALRTALGQLDRATEQLRKELQLVRDYAMLQS